MSNQNSRHLTIDFADKEDDYFLSRTLPLVDANSTILIDRRNSDVEYDDKLVLEFEGNIYNSKHLLFDCDFRRNVEIGSDVNNIICEVFSSGSLSWFAYDALKHGSDGFTAFPAGEDNFYLLENCRRNMIGFSDEDAFMSAFVNNEGNTEIVYGGIKVLANLSNPKDSISAINPVEDFSIIPGITEAGIARMKNLYDVVDDIILASERKIFAELDNMKAAISRLEAGIMEGRELRDFEFSFSRHRRGLQHLYNNNQQWLQLKEEALD